MAASIIKALFSPISVVVNFYTIHVGRYCLKLICSNFLESFLSWRTMLVDLGLEIGHEKKIVWTWWSFKIAMQRNDNMSRKHIPHQFHQCLTRCMGCCFILLKPHILKVMKQFARFRLSEVTKHGTVTKTFLKWSIHQTASTLGSLRFRTCPSKIGCPRIHYNLIGIRTASIKHETNAEGTMRSYWKSAIWNKQLHNKFLPFTWLRLNLLNNFFLFQVYKMYFI